MSTNGAAIRHDLRELIPAVIYSVITFNIIGLTKVLMLGEFALHVLTMVGVTIGVLLVTKVVLLVGVLPFYETPGAGVDHIPLMLLRTRAVPAAPVPAANVPW